MNKHSGLVLVIIMYLSISIINFIVETNDIQTKSDGLTHRQNMHTHIIICTYNNAGLILSQKSAYIIFIIIIL